MRLSKTITLAAAAAIAAACVASCASGRAGQGKAESEATLKDAFKDKFLIGAAINEWQVAGADTLGAQVAARHFNTIVAENVMKSEKINPRQGYYNWGPADDFVRFGEENDMFIVGHCLVWHSQLAPWFAVDAGGQPVSADTLKQRMRAYIGAVVGRYKGRVNAWDVVNEAIEDDGSYRLSPFYQILGEEYIPFAFELARQADPDAELYINDYGMDKPGRRAKYVEIVNDLKSRGLRIDGIGMQAHMGIDYPVFDEFERSINEFAGTGCSVMLTEWDMSALPTVKETANVADTVAYQQSLNPYPDGLPKEVDEYWNSRMDSVLDICLRHSDVISRVNAWGISDGDSWKNDWPIRGRKEYPLLFDRDYQMKPFLRKRLDDQTANHQ